MQPVSDGEDGALAELVTDRFLDQLVCPAGKRKQAAFQDVKESPQERPSLTNCPVDGLVVGFRSN